MSKLIRYWILVLAFHASGAAALDAAERMRILDAARPRAAGLANQIVRIKVDILNVDSGWAVLVGSLVGAPGKAMDWTLADNCNPHLDKMLWVVLQKEQRSWQVRHIDICASEPPYWDMSQYQGETWPCGVFAGLEDGGGDDDDIAAGLTMEQRCRRQRRRSE